MLAWLGFAMVAAFMTLILTGRLSALIALILVPVFFGLVSGQAAGLGGMILDGLRNLAPTGIMLLFAILYFGIMIDAGLFEPLVKAIVRLGKGDPYKIVLATAGMALLVSLDGDGSSMYLIVVGAMLPLYRRLKMNPLILTALLMQASHVMNVLPWGGPTARAASALNLSIDEVFLPLLFPMALTIGWVLVSAYFFGKQERARLGKTPKIGDRDEDDYAESENPISQRHRKLFPVNLLLTVALMVGLTKHVLPLPVLFMIGFAVAIAVNYPKQADQQEKVKALAGSALPVAVMVFAAGVFTGVLSGTKMVDAMAQSVVSWIPASLGPFFGVIVAGLSLPFTFFMSNDAFYFGILPILSKAAGAYGFTPAQIGAASIVGQQVHLLSPLVPSTYLLVGLVKVDFGTHQRFTLPWALGSALVLLLGLLLTGAVPLMK